MNNQELQNQIDVLTKQVRELEKNAIQVQMDPTTSLYLNKFIDTRNATYPSQTYSTSAPSGVAPTGSIWMVNTGVLATNEIYMYSGGWIKIK